MDKKRHAELKELLITVFDEALAILADEERAEEPGISKDEIYQILAKDYTAVAFAINESIKDEMISFIAAENNMGTEEGIVPSEERKIDTIRLFKKIEQSLSGRDAINNAELALRFISTGYQRHIIKPDSSMN